MGPDLLAIYGLLMLVLASLHRCASRSGYFHSVLQANMAEFKENRLNSAWGRFQLTSAVQSPAGPNSMASCSACRVDQPIDSLIVKIVLLVFFMSVFFQGEAMQAVFAEGIGTKLDRDSTEP